MADESTRIARPGEPAAEADQTRIAARPSTAPAARHGQSDSRGAAAGAFGVPRLSLTDRAEFKVGDVLNATFRIEELLAKGGMGAVYRAKHMLLGTDIAVKVILPELAEDEDIVQRMTGEAINLHEVKNDAVVEYGGFFQDDLGRRFLVMEYVDRPSLAAIRKERRLSPDEVRTLRDRLALGFAAAHAKGVLHRDISPDNVILPGGRIEEAKIIDFGIAKSTKGGEHTVVGGGFVGKYSYASPEQFDEAIEPDGRSDIYSLGLVLAAAAIGFGARLDMGNSLASAVKARQVLPDLEQVPEELRDEIAAMLQPSPEQRPQSMGDLVRWGQAPRPGADTSGEVAAPARRGGGRLVLGILGIGAGCLVLGLGLHAAVPSLLAPDLRPISNDIDRVTAGLRCATLTPQLTQDFWFRTHLRIAGFVPTREDIATLTRELGAIRGVTDVTTALQVVDWPFCDAIKIASRPGTATAPRLEAGRPDFLFKNGESYRFTVTDPQSTGFLYVDLIDGGGDVLHLVPSALQTIGRIAAGQPVTVSSDKIAVVSPPYGTQMVFAVVAKRPLFAVRRAEVENAAGYFDALRGALKAAQDRDGAASVALAYRLFQTVP